MRQYVICFSSKVRRASVPFGWLHKAGAGEATMPDKPLLTATSDEGDSDQGKITVASAIPIDFTVVASAALATGQKIVLRNKDGNKALGDFTQASDANLTYRATTTLAGDAVVYAAIVEDKDGVANDIATSNDLTVTVGAATGGPPGGPPPNSDNGPATIVPEVAPGEYDANFAGWAAGAAAIVIAAIIWTTLNAFGNLDVPRTVTTLADKAVISGTFGERIAAGIIEGTLAVGAVMLVAGAFMAALETRGRLRRPDTPFEIKVKVTPGGAAATARGAHPAVTAIQATGEVIANLFGKVALMRAVAITLALGGLLVIASLWAATSYIPSNAPPIATTTSSPATTTIDGADGVTTTTAPTASGDDTADATTPTASGDDGSDTTTPTT